MMYPSPSDTHFQQLLERSDQVFSKVRSILAAQSPDREAMTELVAEGTLIADEMNDAVRARRVFKVSGQAVSPAYRIWDGSGHSG